ncbi:MAG: ribonuclease G [Waddliaceae bacterium]|nr:ribonuclease G [Waddliaceae bacterium]
MEEILLNIESKEIRYAHLRHGQLHDLIVERKQERQLTGNIYRGRVTNILENIQSAFININEGENGFIHISDIVENARKLSERFGIEFEWDDDQPEQAEDMDIVQALQVDQPVLVQVIKEPIGNKGARLTSKISIAGRYLVLLPNSTHRGVSRKIEDRGARDRLKRTIRSFKTDQPTGFICRTASRHVSSEVLLAEAQDLCKTWQQVMDSYQEGEGPALLYEESDIVKRALLTAIDKKFDRILVDDYQVFQQCKRIYSRFATEHNLRIEFYRDKIPMFERFSVEREISKALRRKIWLNSGGYLYFDRTEAMHTVDVNSGRNNAQGVDVEETLVRVNLEAADEIARQLRLRNVGGLVICDFIDMRSRKNQRRVLERLKECMKEDSAKCTVLGMSEFGLVEMTRQRHRGSLTQTLFTACPYCTATGLIKTHESVSIEIERQLKKVVGHFQQYALRLDIHPDLYKYLQKGGDQKHLASIAENMNAHLEFGENDEFHLNTFEFYSTITQKPIEV